MSLSLKEVRSVVAIESRPINSDTGADCMNLQNARRQTIEDTDAGDGW